MSTIDSHNICKKYYPTGQHNGGALLPSHWEDRERPSPSLPCFLQQKLEHQESILYKSQLTGNYLAVGRSADARSITLQSNDYLDISQHESIRRAQVASLQNKSKSTVMSAVFLGEDSKQAEFESAMARFSYMPAAVLCQSGWAANVGLMQVIADETIPVYIDMFTHMSLWEGVKQTGAPVHAFRHNDVRHLESLLKKNGAGVVLTESIFSTTGVVAPLREIVRVANLYDCISVVDESHSLGTHGPQGAGLVAELGLSSQVHFITSSLAKAFAGRAGVILGSKEVCERLPFLAFPAIFSSAMLPYEIDGLLATLSLIKNSDHRRWKLHANAAYLRAGLSELGYNIESHSQIIALEAGVVNNTGVLRDRLDEENILGSAFYPPATPRTRSLVRFSLNAGLDEQQLDSILRVCADIREDVGMWQWKSVLRKQRRKH